MIPTFVSPVPAAVLATEGWWEDRSYRKKSPDDIAVHEGIDFRAPVGTPIYSVGDGVVANADNNANSYAGKNIAVTHDGGLTSQYFHLDRLLVTKGQRVRKGEQIAYSGDTANPRVKTPHLHFGFKMLEANLAEYAAKFGKPATGWGPTKSPFGVSVPTEPLIPMMMSAKVAKNAAKWGLPSFRAVGFGLAGAVLLGLGAFWFFVWRKRA